MPAKDDIDGRRKTAMLTPFFPLFDSLSSFIRQLSYYSFKRLSDRRRSAERRSTVASYIVFTFVVFSPFSRQPSEG
jgi:hypothetical protein